MRHLTFFFNVLLKHDTSAMQQKVERWNTLEVTVIFMYSSGDHPENPCSPVKLLVLDSSALDLLLKYCVGWCH